MDKGLLQAELAVMLGVDKTTVWNWEHGRAPALRYMPAIIGFLGRIPVPPPVPADPLACLQYVRRIRGWTLRALGKNIGIHHELIQDWFTGRSRPSRRNIEKIARFLAENLNSAPEGSISPESGITI
jgi:transcriptional regulator with XRE-family HTH domain